MDEINLKNFPEEISPAPSLSINDKILVAKGDKSYVANFNQLSRMLDTNGQRIESVEPGELPYIHTKATKFMVVTEEGDYYFEGVLLANNPNGYQTTFFWDGEKWIWNETSRTKGDEGEQGVGIATVEVDDENNLIVTKTDGVEVDAGKIKAGSKWDSTEW